MGTSDLINLIMAILVGGGTITLAVMTWKSIRQTRDIQKDEKRERLLNEIIEWAINVSKYGLDIIIPPIPQLVEMEEIIKTAAVEHIQRNTMLNIWLRLPSLKSRGEHAKVVALEFPKTGLQQAVDNVLARLTAVGEVIEKRKSGNGTIDKELMQQDECLQKSVNNLIREASTIKGNLLKF